MGKRRRRVLVKPNRHALIEQHQRIVGRQILRNNSNPPAGQQNDQNSDGQVQSCITLRRKTVLQKLSLFLEPLVAHSPIQPFSLRRKRGASCCRLDRKPLTMRRARLHSRFRSPFFARSEARRRRVATASRPTSSVLGTSATAAIPFSNSSPRCSARFPERKLVRSLPGIYFSSRSNETELSHRWRQRALLRNLMLKSCESYLSERPAVGCSD